MTKYAYIKNGDAVSQLSSISSKLDENTTSGPNAFIKNFLTSINGEPVVIVSLHNHNAKHKFNNMEAYVFNSGSSFLGKFFFRPISLARIFFTLLSYKPDRILCGSTGAVLWVGFAVSRILQIPMVHSRHNRVVSNNDKWIRRIRSFIDVWCIVRMKAVICHGPYLRDELLKVGVVPGKLFEFDVNFEDLLTECNKERNYDLVKNNDSLILFIGRMEQNKGIFDLYEVFKKILQTEKGYRLIYIGDGTDRSQLQNLINSEKLNDHVQQLGSVRHSDLSLLIGQSKLVVTPTLPSFPEGRCMVVMESLVLGVPVIAPRFGPFPYLVQHEENGLLFQPGSVSSLQNMLTLFIQNESLRQKLKQGSILSGKKYIKPDLSFGQAVSKAFT